MGKYPVGDPEVELGQAAFGQAGLGEEDAVGMANRDAGYFYGMVGGHGDTFVAGSGQSYHRRRLCPA
jgi:hypothetical protein